MQVDLEQSSSASLAAEKSRSDPPETLPTARGRDPEGRMSHSGRGPGTLCGWRGF